MDANEARRRKSPKDAEIERLSKLPDIPHWVQKQRPPGVLLSDEIEYYCKNYKLVDPYEPANIMAASYELRVGLKYAWGGKRFDLRLGEMLTIPQFEVAVIEILETINMPDFLIGRWNIRTRWAYEGLIWVGGPQVNPGFRGLLLCPIWNLSDRDIEIKCGESIAVMDFETTTPPTNKSNRKPLWNERSRFIFEDYKADKLRSGLIRGAVDAIKRLEKESAEFRGRVENVVEQTRTRMDGVTAVMFTALGVLTAAVAVFATIPHDAHYWWDPSLYWLCSIATVLALMAWIRSRSEGKWWRRVQYFVLFLAVLAIGLQVFLSFRQVPRVNEVQTEIQQLKARMDALEHPKK